MSGSTTVSQRHVSFSEDVELRVLESKLELLTLQRQLSELRCLAFLEELEHFCSPPRSHHYRTRINSARKTRRGVSRDGRSTLSSPEASLRQQRNRADGVMIPSHVSLDTAMPPQVPAYSVMPVEVRRSQP